MMKKSIALILAAVILTIIPASAGCSPEPVKGDIAAPDFQLDTPEGKTITLSEFRGRPVLLNFWATWCPPCRAEMPFLQELYEDEDWQERGLVILAINISEQGEHVRGFMEENGLTFTALLDTQEDVTRQYAVGPIPTTFIINKDGIIKNVRVGAFVDKKQIERTLEKALED
jgi:peroxiredoxin